jgi:O-antigen ligase
MSWVIIGALGLVALPVFGPGLVKSAANDAQRIGLVGLYITAWTVPVSIALDPSGTSQWTTQATQGGMLLAACVGGLAVLGAFQHRGGARGNWGGSLLVLYMTLVTISGLVNGAAFQLRLLAIPTLTFAVVTAQFDVRRLTLHLRYITRGVIFGSLAYAWLDYTAVDFIDNQRTLNGFTQLAGLTPHPNALGPLAALAIAVELAPASRRRGLVGMVSLAAAVTACLLAQSRAGWICAVMVLALSVLAAVNSRPLTHAVAFFSVLGGVLWLGYRSATVFPGHPIVEVDPNSLLSGRLDVWQIALRPFFANPVIGAGTEAFGEEFRAANGIYGAVTGQAHNQILQVLAETGVTGLILFVVLAWVWWTAAFRSVRAGVWLPLIALVLVSADGLIEAPLRLVLIPDTFLVFATAALLRSRPSATSASEPVAEPALVRAVRP